MVSTIGSFMTVFALTIWLWERSESATTLTFVMFFSQLPRIFITPVAGIVVDRFPRKYLMLSGDLVALVTTLIIGLLHLNEHLQIWHLYWAVAFYGCFGQLQTLAYATSISLLVPKHHYTRAEAMVGAVNYSAVVFAPILAGSVYPVIGLEGIIAIDLTTFFAALTTLLAVSIPSLTQATGPGQVSSKERLWKRLTVGFRYILARPGLVAMMLGFSLFALPNDIGRALYHPMILARSGGDAQVLGSVSTAAGIGGVLGAIAVSLWGGTKRRVHGMLLGFVIAGTFKMLLACGHGLMLWAVAHFCATLSVPLFYSCSNAIWYAKVPPALQGRVLAADQMVGLIIGAIAPLLAGPMADDVFEPAMRSGGSFASLLGPIFGTGPGAGMALLYAVTALWIVLVGVGGYAFRTLRQVDAILPDHDTVTR
jgi:hypothetical protein